MLFALAVTPIPTGATANIYGQVTGTGDGTSGVYFWGFQVEQRSALTALTQTTTAPITNYIPALQTAAANVARFDNDPVTGESKGLLMVSWLPCLTVKTVMSLEKSRKGSTDQSLSCCATTTTPTEKIAGL